MSPIICAGQTTRYEIKTAGSGLLKISSMSKLDWPGHQCLLLGDEIHTLTLPINSHLKLTFFGLVGFDIKKIVTPAASSMRYKVKPQDIPTSRVPRSHFHISRTAIKNAIKQRNFNLTLVMFAKFKNNMTRFYRHIKISKIKADIPKNTIIFKDAD